MGGGIPPKPKIPDSPFIPNTPINDGLAHQRAEWARAGQRDSERWYIQHPIPEEREQHQEGKAQHGNPLHSSPYSQQPPDPGSRSQLGTGESLATAEFPSRDSTRGSSANSRCPFLPCKGCIEQCLDTQDSQQHYRPSWAYMSMMLLLLLGITVLSLMPLAGTQGGWAQFHQSNITSGIMQQLGLAPWNHYIDVGYIKFTTALRHYSSQHDWYVMGMFYAEYAHLWDNVRYGNEAQLLGGYSAGWLLLSALSALVYLGFWLRAALLLRRLAQGQQTVEQEPGKEEAPASLNQWTLRPLGAWLWPVAVAHTAVLVALLTAFLLVVQASNDFQCVHIAPGIDCFVHPAWALWCAYGAGFTWAALALLAMIEACKQRPAFLNHPGYGTPVVARSHQGTERSGSPCLSNKPSAAAPSAKPLESVSRS